MAEMVLYLGNRNYSSWSLRAWLALEQSGLSFREEMIWFDQDADRRQRLGISPAGRVPVLVHGGLAIWDSLAIAEYLAELAPDAGLWPEERAARARARSLCAEMHSGFPAIRKDLPMNVRAHTAFRQRGSAVAKEIDRLTSMWTDTRREFGAGGDLLFGSRSLADTFYAPIAFRFRTYGIETHDEATAWLEALLNLPPMRDWAMKAESEGHPAPAFDALLEGPSLS